MNRRQLLNAGLTSMIFLPVVAAKSAPVAVTPIPSRVLCLLCRSFGVEFMPIGVRELLKSDSFLVDAPNTPNEETHARYIAEAAYRHVAPAYLRVNGFHDFAKHFEEMPAGDARQLITSTRFEENCARDWSKPFDRESGLWKYNILRACESAAEAVEHAISEQLWIDEVVEHVRWSFPCCPRTGTSPDWVWPILLAMIEGAMSQDRTFSSVKRNAFHIRYVAPPQMARSSFDRDE